MLFHTIFAAGALLVFPGPFESNRAQCDCLKVVTTLTIQGIVDLRMPNVMLTVLGKLIDEQVQYSFITEYMIGVVIGFVISYRASSGYDRYWLGRTYWSEVVRNARTMGRLIWFHVPPRSTPRRPEEEAAHVVRPAEEMVRVMSEKTMALDLIEGYVHVCFTFVA